MKRVKVDMTELVSAFQSASYEQAFYLDTETGEVLLIPEDARMALNEFLEEDESEDEDEFARLDSWFAESSHPDWEHDLVRDALRIENDVSKRYIEVPPADSGEGYRDMEEFAVTVADAHLRESLHTVLRRPKPFRRFKDVLSDDLAEREQWFKFQDDRLRQRVLEWLESEDIEPIAREETGPDSP